MSGEGMIPFAPIKTIIPAPPPTAEAIEEVARRICQAKGLDPDARAYQDREWPLPPAALGPQWRQFADAALAGLIAAAFLRFG